LLICTVAYDAALFPFPFVHMCTSLLYLSIKEENELQVIYIFCKVILIIHFKIDSYFYKEITRYGILFTLSYIPAPGKKEDIKLVEGRKISNW
jgi:hypothetical protein